MNKTLIRVFHLNKSYLGMTMNVLSDVNFTVDAGEYVAIMGKSGSGKSTLLHVMAGLDKPTQGEVRYKGDNLTDLSESQLALLRRTQVGFVHQFFNLIDNMTVLDNVVMPALLTGMKYRDAKRIARELFVELEIDGLDQRLPSVLSGGQKQRIAIARALINKPTLIFADEPTGSLDTQSGDAVLKVFRKLHAEGYTIIMVTHDPKVASQADRILFMQDGRLTDETVIDKVASEESLMSKVLNIF